MAEYLIPIVVAAVSVAGTAYSAYSSHQAGEAAESAEKKQAYMLSEQARVREEQQRLNAKRLLATQRSRIGASGVTMEGSPLLGMMETQAQYEKDLLNIRMGTQWELSETLGRGKAYGEAGNVRAGTTLLTGLGNIAQIGNQYGWFKPSTPNPKPISTMGYYDIYGNEFGSSSY